MRPGFNCHDFVDGKYIIIARDYVYALLNRVDNNFVLLEYAV